MIASGALFSRESYSPATLLFRLFFFALLAVCIAPSASAQYQTYPIYTGVSSVPAGSYGATFLGSVNDTSTTANFNVCFDTGYGSSKVPIVPFGYVNFGNFSQFNFVVPAATIQAVPPTAFVNGSFTVSIYSIPPKYTACNGNEPGTPQGNTVTLNYPVLRSVSLPYLPEQNAALSAREPSSVAITGENFISNSGTKGTVPSAVNFTTTSSLAGKVTFISQAALATTIPTTIPATASSVSIQVCNTATYSYCSNSLTLKTVALQQNPGTLIATPSPALTTQPVTLTANFGPARHTVAGAPSGLVTFGDWGTTLGTAPLVLDKTATLVQAPSQQFLVYALPIPPIVADFNRDGIPDTLFIDPGTGNAGASLNLLFGTVPSGSFSANQQFYVINDGPSFTISSAAVGDFNGDGIPDIVLLATEPEYNTGLTLYTMLGNGDGTFQDGFSSSPALYGSQIVAGDFNKDGKQDIVIAGALNANQTIGLQTLLGDGTGNFTAGPATTGLRTAPSPYFGDFKVVAADFNADGYPDVAVMNGYSAQGQLDNSIELYQNNGKAVFLAPVRVQTDGTQTANFFVAPLGPGKPLDIIVTSTTYSSVDVALNQSTTAKIAFFGTLQATTVPNFAQAVFGDFDGDGLLDVAVDDQKTIHVLSGTGSGNFTSKYPSLSIVPPGTTLIAASDENGDKYADLLLYTVGTQDGNTRYPITLYDYITAGTATAVFPPTTFAAGTHPLHASTNGTFDILAGTATTTLAVTAPTPSTVTLTASPATPANYGTVTVKLTAVVPVSSATGTMSFYNGNTLLGTAPMVDQTNSTATFTTAVLPAGTYSFKAVYGGDITHGTGTSALVPYVINPIDATLAWKPNPATIVYGTPLSAAQLNATATGITGATVAGAFTYAPALGTVLTVGTHSVVATFKPTDTNYTSSTITQNITVTQATPTVTWKPNPATIVYGTPLSAAQLDATASTPGSFVYTPALGTVLTVGTHTLSAVFTPTDTNDFKAITATTNIVVTISTPVITWTPNPATIPYGTALSAAQLDAATTTAGTFAYTPALGAVLTAGPQTLSTTFTPKDTTDFKPVTTTTTIVVTSVTPTITWTPNPATIAYGTALSAAQLDATSTTPGTFSYTPALGATLATGTQTLTAVFTPKDSTDFSPVTTTATIVVTSITPTITWKPSPATISYGTALSASQLDATSSTPGTFAYIPGLGAVLGAGTQTLTAVFTPQDALDFKSVTSTTTIVVTGVSPAVTWLPNPATIVYGTPLSAAQLDATSTTPGTFAYTPALGTILTAGTQTLSVLFTPTDSVNFKPQTSTATITVTPATPTITWVPNPSDITYGTPLSASQLDATANTPGTFVYTPVLGTVLTAGAHVLSVTFTPKDATDFNPITTTANVLVGIAQPVLTWVPNPATITYGTTLSAAQLDATASTPGSFTYTPALGTVLDAGPHILSVTFKPTDTTDFSPITSTVPITVDPATPTVTWNPNPSTITYGTPLSAAQLDATSTLAGAYTYGPANGAILTAGPQTLTLRFNPTDTNYSVINLTRAITVSQAKPVLTWATPAAIDLGTALSATQLDATAVGVGGLTLPGAFTYTPATGTVLPVGANTLSVLFSPTDSVDYTTATASVIQAVGLPATVTRLATSTNSSEFGQPVTFTATTLAGSNPANGTTNFFDGTTLIGSSTTSPAALTISTLTAGTHDIVATFVANNSFAGSTSSALAQKVNAAATTIAWAPNPATITFNTPLSAAQLDATVATTYIKTVPGVFTYTPALGTVLSSGTQTLKVTFTPTDTLDYLSSTGTALVSITTINPVVTWTPNPASITYGTALSAAQLDATSTIPGTYTYSPALGAILTAGTQTLTLSFHPTDPNYNVLNLTRTISVVPAAAVISWTPNPATITYSTPLSAAQLDATSSTPGTFTYTPALGTVLSAGTQNLAVLFTPNDAVNYKPQTATTAITVTQAAPTITWLPNPATIAYGTALSAAQLDATSNTPGNFAYTPALGTVLGAGTQTLSVSFTPTDAINFKSVTTTTTVAVTQITPTITWLPNPASIAYGTGLSAAQLDATSATPGTFTYTPALGAILQAGTQTLSVLFTPTEAVDFKSVTATANISVTQASPAITWLPSPATISYGTALSAAQLDAISTTPGTFTYTPAVGTVLAAGTQTLTAVFTPTDTLNFKPVTTTATITVSQAKPVLKWATPAAIVSGTPLSATQLDAIATGADSLTLPGTFTYTPAAGAILPAGSSTLSVLFTPTDAVDYTTATTTVLQSVNLPATTTVLTSSLAQTQFGQPVTFNAVTTSTKPVTGTLSFYDGTTLIGTSSANPASVTLSTLTAGNHSISAIFAANESFAGSTSGVLTQTVSAATTSITWTPNPATIVYGNPLTAAQLDATASTAYTNTVPGTFAYSPALGAVLAAGAQTLKVTFTPTDAVDYLPITSSALVTVTGGTPVITWVPAPATITYGTALSVAQLDATASTPGTFTYTPALGSVLAVGTQTLSVFFTPTDTVHFKSVSTTSTITVVQATPTVTWLPIPATIAYGTPLSVAQLDATSTTPGTFTYTPALGTTLTAGTQTLSAVFTPTDTTNFKAVNTTATITVTSVSPTISWTPNPTTITYGTALSAAQLDATSSTPGTFIYTPALGTVLSAGTQALSVVFTPKDTTDFKSATTTTTIVVTAAAPIVIWTPTPFTIAYGTALTAAQLDATSTTPGTFTYTPALGTILNAGTQTLSAVFTPTDTTNFKSVTTSATIVVTAITPTVAWTPSPSTIPYGTALSAAQLDATSTTSGAFTYTPALGTVLSAGTQTLSVLFNPTDSVNYQPATLTTSIVVTAITPTIAWAPSPATIAYGTPLSAAQLDATSATPGTFIYTPALGTVLTAGNQTLTSAFTPKDTTNYKSVTSTTTIVVTAVTPSVTWAPNPATITYGTPLSAAQLDATTTTAGNFTYTPALGTILAAGPQILSVTFTPKDATDFNSITTTIGITVTAATPAVTWTPNPATITYGTALSAAQLDATSGTTGTFVYTPSIGTMLTVGTQTISAVFTPTDTKDFNSVTTTATIVVTAATPVVTWTPSPATITYGIALSAAQLDANSTTPGTFVYTPALGTVLTAGTQTLSAVFTPTDAKDFKSVTTTATITITAATPLVTWLPNPASIAYGTALSAAQLDAASTTPGTFTYTPAFGTVLTAGTQTLSALFTPTDAKDFKSVTASATITVTQSAPTIAWATPASIIVGTKLSGAQLDAAATGVNGVALAGTFTYTPAAGTLLTAGTQTLKVVFSPSDLADYTTATASVSIEVVPVTLTALSATSATLGDPAKTITLTGTGFVPTAVVQVNGIAISTTFVGPTTLTAIIPAADFLVVQTLQISVAEASQNQTTASIALVVGAPMPSAVFTGPSSIQPGTQTELTFKLNNPYPVDLSATFNLAFTPAAGLPSDPNVLFASGGTVYKTVIPANSTASPSVAIQGSTVAGTMTVDLTLEAGGVNVTPPTIQPLVIQAPLAVPGLNSVAFTRSGNTLTVTLRGLSNPRDMTLAKFHFTPVPGGSIGTEDVTIDVVPIFTTWYADPASFQYGSTFTYTQIFNLSSDASVVGQVSVTLVNSVGGSPEANTP